MGLCTLGPSFRAGLTLLTFFFTSSKLTQLGEELKEVDEEHKKGGQRDWRQASGAGRFFPFKSFKQMSKKEVDKDTRRAARGTRGRQAEAERGGLTLLLAELLAAQVLLEGCHPRGGT